MSLGTCLPYNTVITVGGAAGVNSGTIGGAVVVGYSTVGVVARVKSESAINIVAVYPGSSTVLVAVVIVVEHRARLLVS